MPKATAPERESDCADKAMVCKGYITHIDYIDNQLRVWCGTELFEDYPCRLRVGRIRAIA